MNSIISQLHTEWQSLLASEFEQDYFKNIGQFLIEEKERGETVFPPESLIFNAFNRCPPSKLKIVILGQDPYHGAGQAHGLCFSVADGVKSPPSLVNIYKELHNDLGLEIPSSGNLEKWADQGVLLLNAFLSVREKSPASHSKIGWGKFTNAVIQKISAKKEGVIFLLWGKFAQKKAELIDKERQHVLMAAHPSPFSAYNGFFGCKHFSKCNEILEKQGEKPMDWQI